MSERFKKLRSTLRYFLLGKEYYKAVEALDFAEKYHTGTRKDGITPEFQHQIEIAQFLRTLMPFYIFPEDTMIAAILHDVCEDYDVSNKIICTKFGERVGNAVFLLDKRGKSISGYFEDISTDEVASIVKGADRINNLQSMVGVFSTEKQLSYIQEVEQHFLPMLKTARRSFPRQESAYENIKHMLCSQVQLIKIINEQVPK